MISVGLAALMNFCAVTRAASYSLGGLLGKMMHGAMDIGVGSFVIPGDGVDHRARLLRGGGVIEIDERLAVNLLLEDRKIGADALDVESA